MSKENNYTSVRGLLNLDLLLKKEAVEMANFPQSGGECLDISSPPFSLSDSATRTLSPSNNLTLTRSASARKSTQRRLCMRKRYDVNRLVHHRHQRTCFW
jgi:hypothetical protein